jgi:thiol-disulfide isomerase/thioredoxin
MDARLNVTAALAAALCIGAGAWAQHAEPATEQAPSAKAKSPRPPIYSETADARKDIAAALAKAKRENQRVLIQWGANWCGWCHLLHETFAKDKEIAKELNYEYVVVLVDTDRNKDLPKDYGATIKGIPYLTVLDAQGKVVVHQETDPLERKPTEAEGKPVAGHDRSKVLAFLKQHEAPPPEASQVLSDAREKARASGRLVMVRWGAPWCGWCHKMDDWLARPEVAALMDKDYVSVKIDQDRMTGGKELLAKYSGGARGIPWFAILDPAGEVLAVSDRQGQNIGFPAQPGEIDHFMDMVGKTAKKLSESDRAALRRTLEKPKEEERAAR